MMFITADKLLSRSYDSFRTYHVLSFYWNDFVPYLQLYDIGQQKVKEIEIKELAFFSSPEKYCVGHFKGSEYVPCPTSARVTRFSQCPQCASSWIPYQECIFEPKCNGELCSCEFCSKHHVVYAAVIHDTIKIGMTGLSRLRTRGIEQGADAILQLIKCDGRSDARKLERRIAKILNLPQLTGPEVNSKCFMTPLRRAEAEEMLLSIRDRLSKEFQVVDSEVLFLDLYPIERYLDSPLEPIQPSGIHIGRVLGVKGRFLLYQDRSTDQYRVVDISDLPCRYIRDLHERDNYWNEDAPI
ncbi:MAG: DUF2797 domain-containing protein [Methanomassiliicoccales archaeon]|jgi:hypothetical protein|nr:DUF2797 domain-containing protein [Methanomassiliicoccales archaeon]